MKHFYRDLGRATWDVYGFRNAINETDDWYSPDELALNQGPQAVMIENAASCSCTCDNAPPELHSPPISRRARRDKTLSPEGSVGYHLRVPCR